MRNSINPNMGASAIMTTFMRQLALVSACAVITQGALAAQVSLNQVIPLTTKNGDTELRLVFTGAPPAPQAYQIENPARLVLDFPNAVSGLNSNKIAVSSATTKDVDVTDNQERTRLVINLVSAGTYSTRQEGNSLILKISRPATAASVTPVAATPAVTVQEKTVAAAPVAAKADIRNINFQRGSAGDGQVVVDLANPSVPVDVQQQGSKIVVRFLGTKVPQELRRRLDVNDFATPVSTIDAYNEGSNGVMLIQPQGPFEYLAYQTDNKLTISVKQPPKPQVQAKKEEVYSGQKLSLNFQDIDVRSVLQLIADFTNLNLVASDSVNGKITIRLQNVPWDQALDIILKTKGLDKRRTGNVIMVAPTAEIAAREKLEAQANMQTDQLAPLQTEYIPLSYAKARDIQNLITSGVNNGSNGGGLNGSVNPLDGNVGSLLSPRGTVSVDPRTNTIIVHDTAKKIDEIRNMLTKLDVPVKQVMIEARIVRASNDFSREIGVKWGVLSQGITNNNSLLVGGTDTTLWNLRTPEKDDVSGGYKYTIDQDKSLSVDLGVSNMANPASLALGLISLSDVMLDLELSALQADGQGEVIATPKVLTGDKQKARVASGTQIPYQNATSSGATSTSFVNAELSLEVTPSITADGRIGMELLINSDTPGATVPGGIAINTNRVQTNVLVNDGETVVLGGIFQNQTGNTVTKVPLLGDIPLVGSLFRNTYKLDKKQELLIFVTPRLVNDTNARQAK